jgi:hypothetical protein
MGGRIAKAIRIDELELEVPVERFDAAWIKIGDPVTVRSDRRGLKWKGKVIRKSQFVDPNTQSQAIFIKIQNHRNPSLLAGEYLDAEFPGHPIENAMEVPRNVVFNTNEVFVIVDNRLEKRTANIIKVNENTLILSGLQEGELIVMQPLINVLEGTMVERLGDQQDSMAGQSPGLPPQSADEGQKAGNAGRKKPGDRSGDRSAVGTGQKDGNIGKKPSKLEDSTGEEKKGTDQGQPE